MTRKLSPDELYKCCDPSLLGFETTREVTPLDGTIGQERAMRSLDFGLSLESAGYNIFILGESGTGKMTSIKSLLGKLSVQEPVPSDWIYVYNFKDPDVPKAIAMKPGHASAFKKEMDELVNTLRSDIPKIFESKEYDKQRSNIMEEFQKKQREILGSLEQEAESKGFSIRKTVSGLLIVPVKKSGEPLSEEEFEALEEDKKKKIEEMGKALQEKLDDAVRTIRGLEKEVRHRLSRLEREAALSSAGHLIEELKNKYGDYEKLTEYLEDVLEDILEHLEDFKAGEEQPQAAPFPFMRPPKPEPSFTRYSVNVFVNNSDTKGAPVVFESNPTYYNLFGRVEHRFQYGAAITDFSMIKAGSMHRANGGYIIINALDMLRNIFVYDALKRAIRDRELRIEDVWEQYRLVSTTTLKPEAIPLDIKVVLVGIPMLYYLLYNLDVEYRELFKVKADFDIWMPGTEENIKKYAEFVAHQSQAENLLPFHKSGVSSIIEYGSRLAGHQEKLSAKFNDITDLIRESHYWAGKAGSDTVTAEHVHRALEEKVYRSNKIEERLRELMAEGTLIVETSGVRVGQVNGLAVLSLGDYSFGKPSRITARAYTGKSGVMNIERETKMSGKIHDKASLIITNYLGSRYAARKPISLSASITFEQLYDMVEGDSATCAELYALLSSLSGVPLRQDISVTGSMDQNGVVQPIGGVNEKIEGFFALCKMRGLDGSHGVIIPSKNIKNLMLKNEVVEAVREGRFSIYPIDRMEDGIEILTGMPAGEPLEDGSFPEGTLNHLVSRRLAEISEALKAKKEEIITGALETKGEKEEEKEEEKGGDEGRK
ncbi:MAG: ATP-binding protein [Thermodesulfovibrionales bacterium]